MTRRIPVCQCLANLKAFCQGLAKVPPRAANGFANVWQNSTVFAKHWQNPTGRNKLRPAPCIFVPTTEG
jgi:hypothetical protein